MSTNLLQDKPRAAAAEPARERIRMGTPEYHEIVEFLEDEAFILDEKDYDAWYPMLSEDLIYRMPVRVSRPLDGRSEFEGGMYHFDEDKSTIILKCTRLQSPYAWSENPGSRVRRVVSGFRIFRSDAADEYQVTSSVIILRYRREMEVISAKREDVIRRSSEGLRLARRMIWSDQTTMATQNLSIFI